MSTCFGYLNFQIGTYRDSCYHRIQEVVNRPRRERDASRHRRSFLDRPMHPAEIVMGEESVELDGFIDLMKAMKINPITGLREILQRLSA